MQEALSSTSPTTSSPQKGPRRLTVVERIYFESMGQDPVSTDEGFEVPLTTEEQPFTRKSKVGEAWMKLPVGWFEQDGEQYKIRLPCSMLCLRNDGPDLPQGQPTEEWVKIRDEAVLELGIRWISFSGGPMFYLVSTLSLRRSLRMPPSDLDSLWIRCRKGTTKFTVTLFPS